MKSALACVAAALALGHASAMAQAAGDPMDRLKTCSTLPTAERMKCLDLLSREAGTEANRSRSESDAEGTTAQESWVVSETVSPLDYSPIVIATVTAGGAPGRPAMKLSIACRNGNTSFVLAGPGGLPAGDRYSVSYAIDGGPPKPLVAIAAPSGAGLGLGGDVVGLLVSLPSRGEIVFRIVDRQDTTLEGRYSLTGLTTTRERMAASCKWPSRIDTPRKK